MSLKSVGIIGGGVSGLAAGILLARRGVRVTLYEAGSKLGGCCATTEIGGYSFNDGAVYVAVPEILDHGFARLGLDRAALVPLRPISATQTTGLPDGTTVSFRRGLDVSIDVPGGQPGGARPGDELIALLDKWEPVLRLLTDELVVRPFSLPRLLWKGWRHLPKLHGTIASELDRMIGDPALRAALAGVTLYTGLPPEKTPVFQIVGLVAMLSDRFYMPEGGMGRIPAVLAHALEAEGGEIRLDSKVRRIVVRNGRVCGLDIEDHGRIEMDAVVSTASAMATMTALLDADCVPDAMKRKVKRAPLSQKALSLQLGLTNKVDAPSHFMNRLPMMEEQHKLLLPTGAIPEWLSYTVPTITLPELAPPGGSIIELYPAIDQDRSADSWTDEEADRIADAAIEALSRLHPIDIAVKRVRSPRNFQNDMHLYAGAIYGLSPVADARTQFPHRTPIAGLFQAGQTSYPGYGVSTAMMSGIFAAEALLNSADR